ncbi:hypothetical protein SAY87_017142 [Trapa incisa]|uniref:Uncharacterized protein n=1 Tax=Trapa incisa TaxID=236973 RepID=A0AAN7QY53_9MYRT|nr:hypothetical protein SAY87_017142 [Trapa incisa]
MAGRGSTGTVLTWGAWLEMSRYRGMGRTVAAKPPCMLFQNLRVELSPFGIKVVLVVPRATGSNSREAVVEKIGHEIGSYMMDQGVVKDTNTVIFT